MTSTAKTCKPAAGFTLLEIVIALIIGAMIIGGAAGVMTFSSDEYALKKATREVEAMAKRARATAVLKQTPYALVLTQGMVRLMPWAEAIGDEELEVILGEDGEAVDTQAVHWDLSLDNGMTADVQRWNSEQWRSVTGEAREIWRFDPTGLCEPIRMKLYLKQHTALMEFHPLSAAISELEYDIR